MQRDPFGNDYLSNYYGRRRYYGGRRYYRRRRRVTINSNSNISNSDISNNNLIIEPRCIAITSKGQQCVRRCENKDSSLCKIHGRKANPFPDSSRCTKITSSGSRCVFEVEENKSLCKRHRKLQEKENARRFIDGDEITAFLNNLTISPNYNGFVPESDEIKIEHNSENKENKEPEFKMSELLQNLTTEEKRLLNRIDSAIQVLEEKKYVDPFANRQYLVHDSSIHGPIHSLQSNNSNNSNNPNNLQTNIKTRGERECPLCKNNKQMIIMYCCRKEMCSDCISKISDSKCTHCKKQNSMKVS